ncbi:MAG: hypothetical protein ACOX2O_08105 [Bdellovibrionota bacterium]|jgi:hypothetical protein
MPKVGGSGAHIAGASLSGGTGLADYNFSSKTFEVGDLKKIFKDFIEKEAALTSDSKCRYLDKNGVEKGISSEDIISKINGLLDRLDDNGVSFRSLERLPDLAIVTKDGASVNLKDIFSKGCQILENNEVIKEYKRNIARLPQEEGPNLGIAKMIGGGDVLREIEDILVRECSKESLLDTYKSVCGLMRGLNDVRNDQSKPHKNQLDEESSKSLIVAISAKLKAAKNIPEGAINILDNLNSREIIPYKRVFKGSFRAV